MVQSGNGFALSQRDKIIKMLIREDKAAINYRAGNNLKAALYDFTENLFISAIPQTFLGLSIIFPYATVSYQGWVSGIVSVDNYHHSRLTKIKPALYYFIVLFLQFIPFSLTIGAGIKSGIEIYKQNMPVGWRFWEFRITRENLTDIGNMFIISIPLFLMASLFEFLSSWNI